VSVASFASEHASVSGFAPGTADLCKHNCRHVKLAAREAVREFNVHFFFDVREEDREIIARIALGYGVLHVPLWRKPSGSSLPELIFPSGFTYRLIFIARLRLISNLFQERPIPYLNSTLLKRDNFALI